MKPVVLGDRLGQVSPRDTHNYINTLILIKLPHIEETLTVEETHAGNVFYTVEDLS